MKPHSLSKTGLSMSQAQSISNSCNQHAQEINRKIASINNCERTIAIGGETFVETTPHPIPTDIIQLLSKKAKLHACQAFLMENIKAKDALIRSKKSESLNFNMVRPEMEDIEELSLLSYVSEDWGIEQLTIVEMNEYYEAESVAAHIGQFIHNGGKLDLLRKELSTIPSIDWIVVEKDKRTPIKINVHHTSDGLLKLHDELSKMHREAEQRVNYYKAKMKNLVTLENARISEENSKRQSAYNEQYQIARNSYTEKLNHYFAEEKKAQFDFETERNNQIKELSALRIEVDPRYQEVIDLFLVDSKEV